VKPTYRLSPSASVPGGFRLARSARSACSGLIIPALAFLIASNVALAQRGGPGGGNNNPRNGPPPAPGPAAPAPATPAPAVPPPAAPAPGAPVIPNVPAVGALGGALPGLADAQLAAFVDGREAFRKRESAADGLGPIFNDVSCVACHDAGATGGASRRTVTRFGRTVDGVFDPLDALGGSLLQERAVNPAVREVVPAEANTVARRLTTPIFGLGLIEAIADDTIVAGTLAPKPAGIGGKVSIVRDVTTGTNRVGRYGWKAQQATLLAFSGDAFLNEMGITNRFFPTENAPNGNTARLAGFDPRADLEDPLDSTDGRTEMDRVADFMRLLAPAPRTAGNDATEWGARHFAAIDCAACHTPTMTTARNVIPALSEKTVALYSDLLLHDMGTLGDGIAQGTAGPREMRTPPLWGLRFRPSLLHDGRANSADAAIRAHAGEAQTSRDAYVNMTAGERQELLAFLNSL
jgi:cytochrome c553